MTAALKQHAAWSHMRVPDGKDEWLTPPELIRALSIDFDDRPFDLDPCAPINRPWDTAGRHYTVNENGLIQPWQGRVWCNPPYSQASQWLERCALCGDAIALIFARTETNMFFRHVWKSADAVVFLRGRITFHSIDGTPGKHDCGSPSCLVAWGQHNVRALQIALDHRRIRGQFVRLNQEDLV